MDRRGKHVIGALTHVHVVIGVDRLLGVEPVASRQFDRTVGDHLVDIHVARGARSGLEYINGELLVEFPVDHLLAGGHQRVDLGVLERVLAASGKLAEITVGDSGGQLDASQGMDQVGWQGPATDWKVVDSPLCLGTVIGLGGDLDVTHRVVFGAEIGHCGQSWSVGKWSGGRDPWQHRTGAVEDSEDGGPLEAWPPPERVTACGSSHHWPPIGGTA